MRSVNSPDAEPNSFGPRAGRWRKSSRCAHGDCVEVGSPQPATVAVRDAKHHGTGPSLAFTPAAWRSFVAHVKHEAGR
ncbi:MAG TPA: DUF397 domain-containing protein [Streptosporangiaceae bacterium]|jgi:hypothetical protein|nr:DUF397 domain-containing protein [Streptosporangiaceae bacterium]